MSKKNSKKNKKNGAVSEDILNEAEIEADGLDETQILISSLQSENEKLKNEYYKAYADAENIKKRTQREYETALKYRIQSFALDILPVLDNFERALSQTEEVSESYREGIKMIYDQFMASLKKEGVSAIDALNKEFDPNQHQALMSEAIEGVKPNVVVEELQKGYLLKDRVLRASLVKISQ